MSKFDHLTREQLIALLERREREAAYGLVWERDEIEPDRHLNDDFVALDLNRELSQGDSPYRNLIIEGDNFDALRYLRMTHSGKVKCIYIDPPYNTGNRDFVYNDRFFDSTNRFRHSTWLEFMYRRLLLARDLLHPDGAIFVSIDDNELFPLGMLMHRVFGEKNFVANCIWQKRYSRENRETIGDAHEYLLVYAADPERFKFVRRKLPFEQKQLGLYKNPNNDPNGLWQSVSLTAQGYRPNQMYEITAPSGKKHRPPDGTCWKVIESEYLRLVEQGRIYFGKDGNGVPRRVHYLKDAEGIVPWTWWPHEEVGHTDEARKEIQNFFGTQTAFQTPKPVRLIERILRIATGPDDLVLDFFAGSGTTAHAVLKLNAEDSGQRRFILVSNAEATADEPGKNLCRDVCAERVRRVISGYRNRKDEQVAGMGGDFAYLRTRLLPHHRLDVQLEHDQVWHALQMLHDHPLSPWGTGSLGWSEECSHALGYLANLRETTLEQLRRRLVAWPGELVVYCWAPDRLATLLPGVAARPIPETLAERFGKKRKG
ncbi:MAG: site-specific DNA-methyltransferase [Deltaproteobacteria bacterium]|nr:MAG: site-specific DNA-methyltransferase [Deltaproteobacteria bacterium]